MDSLFFSSPCPSSDSEIGDYVMMESCVEYGDVDGGGGGGGIRPRRRAAREKRRREFPPPLTVLPFAMRRYTTGDGRLVMVEEKGRRRGCFRVTRSDGRLVLEIIEERERGEVEERESDEVEERESDDVEEGERENVVEEERESVAVRSTVVMGSGKCYDYMRVRSSPCLFGMTVPTVRPVHI